MSLQKAQRDHQHMQDNLQKEVDILASALKQNGYPANFILNASAPIHKGNRRHEQLWRMTEGGEETTSCDTLCGWDEWRHVCRKFNMRYWIDLRRSFACALFFSQTRPERQWRNLYPARKRTNLKYRCQGSGVAAFVACSTQILSYSKWRTLRTRQYSFFQL